VVIGKIVNKQTNQDVCQNYLNKELRDFEANIGEDLKIIYTNGSFFTHEKVLECDQDDYGFWIETTNKLWRIDNHT